MAIRLQLTVLTISFVISFCISRTSATVMEGASSSEFSSPHLSPLPAQDFQASFSPMVLFEPILKSLGFQELAMAVPSLSDSAFATWNGPSTIFAPTDASIRSCVSCSVPRLLREHIVPGIFSLEYLRKLAFGTKIETMSPGRCLTVTSAENNTKIFIGGVEITHPNLFNDGLIVVHGLEGFISLLSPFSCNVERMTSLSFPFQPSGPDRNQPLAPSPIIRLMLRDAMLRLRNNGFSVLSLAMRVKYADLVNLHNMTVFALDDTAIFSGGHAYVSNVRFHIVPNRLLMNDDLKKLPAGMVLPTMERGQNLVVTTAGGAASAMRINYVRLKNPDVMYNLKIVVHSVFLPFPHLHPESEIGGVEGISAWDEKSLIGDENATVVGSCAASEEQGGCAAAPTLGSKPVVEMEDHHGL